MALSKWNLFVKKIYHEGRTKDKNYTFQQALKDASKRKSEMNSMKDHSSSTKKHHKSKKGGKSRKHKKKSKRSH
jgi:hypothetical protein